MQVRQGKIQYPQAIRRIGIIPDLHNVIAQGLWWSKFKELPAYCLHVVGLYVGIEPFQELSQRTSDQVALSLSKDIASAVIGRLQQTKWVFQRAHSREHGGRCTAGPTHNPWVLARNSQAWSTILGAHQGASVRQRQGGWLADPA
ncbi:hypothetical protein ASPTUDRAFT_26073 [Aspergillus tubingensis CBS 134.48]|uniref:Uncharacterized protein n=1 Tax=Aspergillus tubingensis (strain CBS 134.48) TaxID=767770 RepID=A0A1L9NMU0_ASPTC|nr:hypothetical protein ASPTUDRAFT_26073 [Aspergillus tubingensis CBS 134.48]